MIFVTGAAGMVGSHLQDVFADEDLYRTDLQAGPGVEALDVRDRHAVLAALERVRPSRVLHLAAETDLDRCEREVDHAYRSNVLGTLNVALGCRQIGAELIYVSTCGVFDGARPEPYTEFDEPHPITVYAKAKYEGEKAVQSLVPRHFVVRAGWMFGGRDKDKKFVGKIAARCLGLEGGGRAIHAVNDRFGSPTYAKDLLVQVRVLADCGVHGLYHVVNRGWASRYDIALEIARRLRSPVHVAAVSSQDFQLSAPRPESETVRAYKLDLLGLNRMPPWQDALQEYLTAWIAYAPRIVLAIVMSCMFVVPS